MQWRDWLSAAVLASSLSTVTLAAAADCGCRGAALMNYPGYAALCGEACCCSPGYALVPGCCENYKPCCDNAWAGYCEHRAKVDARRSRVGVPHAGRHAAVCCGWAAIETEESPLQPIPAAPAEPPEKSRQRAAPNPATGK